MALFGFIRNLVLCVALLVGEVAFAQANVTAGNTTNTNTTSACNCTCPVSKDPSQHQLNLHLVQTMCFPLGLQSVALIVAAVSTILFFKLHKKDDDPWNMIGFGYKAMAVFAVQYLVKFIDTANGCLNAAIFGANPVHR